MPLGVSAGSPAYEVLSPLDFQSCTQQTSQAVFANRKIYVKFSHLGSLHTDLLSKPCHPKRFAGQRQRPSLVGHTVLRRISIDLSAL